MDLRDLPQPLPDWLKENISAQLLAEVRAEAESRRNSVARGAETPELAATLFDKFGWGMSKAAHIIGIVDSLQREVDRLVREIDPEFEAHRVARWAARPASLRLIDDKVASSAPSRT
jgi:hypothetical protein